MPGYGIVGADEGSGLLPWSWAVERLTVSHDYWLATVWPDGRPHLMPVWGVWVEDALWFSSSGQARKTRNLAAEPRCTATTDNALEPVVIEGRAERVEAPEAVAGFAAAVNAKYDTEYPTEFFLENASFRLVPTVAIGLGESDFTGSPTRWRFSR
jgi:nitroimidazol reductase NimA-like FMN-containing flavoprotein (pyridoxamine 5'-phosphate oxidase superfamily)